MTDQDNASGDEMRFIQLIAMFQMAAMQHMGKLANPVTNEIERDLPQARASIDMLETIEHRTQGNRTPAEDEFMEKVLFELRMNYVDETGREEPGDTAEDEEGPATPDGDTDESDGSG